MEPSEGRPGGPAGPGVFVSAGRASFVPLPSLTMPTAARASRLAPFALMGTLLFASHWEVAPMMPAVEWMAPDKAAHFAVFGLLATLWARVFAHSRGLRRGALLGWCVAALFGLLDEGVQALNPVRVFDLVDLAADAAGAFVAVVAYAIWPAYRSLLERPLHRPGRHRPGATLSPPQPS
jgi:VanZ family protein